MITKLNFTTDDGVNHLWVNPYSIDENFEINDDYNPTIYYATLEGILDAAKRYYLHKE